MSFLSCLALLAMAFGIGLSCCCGTSCTPCSGTAPPTLELDISGLSGNCTSGGDCTETNAIWELELGTYNGGDCIWSYDPDIDCMFDHGPVNGMYAYFEQSTNWILELIWHDVDSTGTNIWYQYDTGIPVTTNPFDCDLGSSFNFSAHPIFHAPTCDHSGATITGEFK